jgi:hypothetical protein
MTTPASDAAGSHLTPGRPGWLVSPAFDLGLLSGPAVVAVAIAFALPGSAPLSLAGWIVLVVLIDVAHVYASLYRTYLDPIERRRRPVLYTVTPLAVLAVGSALYSVGEGLFWTVMAYVAVHHFVKQQIGFVALYRVREGIAVRSGEARVERAAVYAVTLFPVVWWHAHLPREFEWFLKGDFLVGLPMWTLVPAGAAAAAAVVAHVVLRVRSRRAAPGRDLWIVTTAAVWFSGIVLTEGAAAFAVTNVVLHGIPYMALVAWVGREQWTHLDRGPALRSLFFGSGWTVFVGLLFVLAIVEEGLWDVLVANEHPSLFGSWSVPGWVPSVAVPLLAVPQVTHYVLDGFIWKLPSNPRLRSVLLPRA